VLVDHDEAVVGELEKSTCPQESAITQPVLVQAAAETQFPPSTFIVLQLAPSFVETRTSPVLLPAMHRLDVQETDNRLEFETWDDNQVG
jgi:hypothetical protein